MKTQETTEFSIISKRKQKMYNKKIVIDRKYAKMINLRKNKLEYKKARELERIENKRKKLMDIEIRNFTHKRQKKIPIDKTKAKIKREALTAIQRYRKLKQSVYSAQWTMIYLMDKLMLVKLDRNVHWWHVYSQKNYPQLAFVENNIRPIHYITNKIQCDTTAERKKNLPNDIQKELEEISLNKKEKRSERDRNFYQWILDYYLPLIEIEEKRLWIPMETIYKRK